MEDAPFFSISKGILREAEGESNDRVTCERRNIQKKRHVVFPRSHTCTYFAERLFWEYGESSLLISSSLVLLIISAGGLCKAEADVIVLIQDSQSISEGTRPSIQRIVKTLLNSLNSPDTDYKFIMGRYGLRPKMNDWGSAAKAISYLNKNYPKGGLGSYNRLIRVLKKSVAKKFNKRSDDRKGKDPVKV